MTGTAAPVYDPLELATHEDPYPVYRRLRRAAPLCRNAEHGFWALSRHADVIAALADPAALASSAPELSAADRFFGIREAGYVAGESARHDALRHVLRPLLGARPVDRLERAVAGIADRLLDDLACAGVADLAAGYARRLPVLVTCEVLGLPERDEPLIAGWVDALFGRRPGVLEVPAEATAAYLGLREYVTGFAVPEAAAAGMASLLEAEREGILTRDEILDVAIILVAAGIKTTSALIGTLLLRLAVEPGQQAIAWAEPALAGAVVDETLRYDAPAQWVARVATCGVETPHGAIPAGERVLLLLGSANRDEARYDRPDRFDVRRAPRRHLAFSSGLHFCLGAPLARLEARVALEALVRRARRLEPAGAVERVFTPAERELAALPCHVAWR